MVDSGDFQNHLSAAALPLSAPRSVLQNSHRNTKQKHEQDSNIAAYFFEMGEYLLLTYCLTLSTELLILYFCIKYDKCCSLECYWLCFTTPLCFSARDSVVSQHLTSPWHPSDWGVWGFLAHAASGHRALPDRIHTHTQTCSQCHSQEEKVGRTDHSALTVCLLSLSISVLCL